MGLPTSIGDNDTGDYKDVKIQVSMVSAKSPAETAGLKMGDVILELRSGEYSIAPNAVKMLQAFKAPTPEKK